MLSSITIFLYILLHRHLKEDPTEDPRHPKLQFPAYSACAVCYKSRPSSVDDDKPQFIENAVLNYLLTFYGRNHIIEDTSPYVFRATTSFYYSSASSFRAFMTSFGPTLLVLTVLRHWL